MPILPKDVELFPETLLDEPSSEFVPSDGKDLREEQGVRWWVAHTKPRQEKALARSLLAAEVPFYLPLIPKEVLIRGRRHWSHVPVFASYVFLYAREEQRILALKSGRVVQTISAPNGKELRCDLQNLQRLIELDAPLTVERRIQAGTRVRVRSGPMEGLEGVVVGRKRRTRLVVMVRMLQQGVSLDIDDILLEPL
jgi:transcriptional antiterminator RfaH